MRPVSTSDLAQISRVLAVVAHPDDESFGLGAVVAALVEDGATVEVLCFTHGEGSTLGQAAGSEGGSALGAVRAGELQAAAEVLGVARTRLLDRPDGGLAEVPLDVLAEPVTAMAGDFSPDAFLVFDDSGITGHPDHKRATAAALAVAEHTDLLVLAWAIPSTVADRLNAEFGTAFVGHPPASMNYRLSTDRVRQRQAIACHVSQATDNAVLRRRLELSGQVEYLRRLR